MAFRVPKEAILHISPETFRYYWKENMERKADMDFNTDILRWTREPEQYRIGKDKIEIVTMPRTDLWQRTYYHFRNDNAPVLQLETEEKYFSFIVKTDFTESHHRFDQCGVVMYLDSENWLKGSVEYENDEFQHLGSVVTNHGYSDWQRQRYRQMSARCGIGSAAGKMIIASNVQQMDVPLHKCVSAICGRGQER